MHTTVRSNACHYLGKARSQDRHSLLIPSDLHLPKNTLSSKFPPTWTGAPDVLGAPYLPLTAGKAVPWLQFEATDHIYRPSKRSWVEKQRQAQCFLARLDRISAVPPLSENVGDKITTTTASGLLQRSWKTTEKGPQSMWQRSGAPQ